LIVVDSSAIIAILLAESDAETFRSALAEADQCVMAASSKLEVMMVAGGRFRADGVETAQAILDQAGVDIVPFAEALSDIAAQAFLRFGKGQSHPAKLNFGDCMAYALAKSLDAPLLYKGDDFALTDIKSAA
jgi:ribonuclease VapC